MLNPANLPKPEWLDPRKMRIEDLLLRRESELNLRIYQDERFLQYVMSEVSA